MFRTAALRTSSTRSTRRAVASLVLAVAAVAGPLVAASPASAELPCPWAEVPGATNPWNYPLDGVACVVLDTSNGIRLVRVTDVQPGWTYTVKSAGGGTSSKPGRVQIRFVNRTTNASLDFRFEPGRTVIG